MPVSYFLKNCYVFVTSFLTLIPAYVRIKKDNSPKMDKVIEVKTLDKQEYRLKTEQMLGFLQNKSYGKALEIAESIDWGKVKNVSTLCTVSEIYEYCGEFQKSRDILFLAYDRAPDSRKIVYRLGTLALKLNQLKEASDCYDEFVALAPKDPNRFIFKYKLLKAKNAPLEEQIEALEEFKKVEYVEKWAFELAELYKEAGMITECLEECEDLILWFNEGKYIYKAMELKMQYKPLTPLQQEKYMSRFQEASKETEEATVEETVEDIVEESGVEEAVAEEIAAEEVIAEETAAEEENKPNAEEEPDGEEKPSLSIAEMVQDWQEQQKENAQIIQAEIEKAEQEKAQSESEPVEEEKEEILSDDVRKLMEELEAESAYIDSQKTVQDGSENSYPVPEEPEEETESNLDDTRSLLRKAVEALAAPTQELPDVEMSESGMEDEKPEEAIETEEKPVEDEGIKLGDTQSMALAAKALENAARVDIAEIEIPDETVTMEPQPEKSQMPYNTGFIVQGRYDLDARSEVGIKAGLTEEEKKLFSYFVPVHGMSEQIVKALQEDKDCKTRYGTSKTGNLLIIGRKGSGKTVLAVDMVKAIQKSRKVKQGKVAIVKAEFLNKKDIAAIFEKLHGGAIVVEKASRLQRNTIDKLCRQMDGQTDELLVVLEDERKPMERMLAEYPEFRKKFTSRIELPVFINDELVTFGQIYAKENGYKIDEMGILALYSDIDILQREEKIVTVSDVKAIVDDAIENENRASVKNLIRKIFGKNRDESGRIILTEEDFR